MLPDYAAGLEWLESHIDYERAQTVPYAAMRPAVVFRLADLLGRPQERFSAFHIAGTKGKGSTSAYIESALVAMRISTGAYRSPHVVDVRERVTVNGKPVDEEALLSAWRRTAEVEERVGERLTYFEIMTAAALLVHADAAVRLAAWEVGIGGRLDATRRVNAAVCVITPISVDHTDKLGETLASIAAEKCGILRPGVPVVVGPQPPEALEVILHEAKRLDAPVFLSGEDFSLEDREGGFSVEAGGERFEGLRIRMAGRHQRENAATAVAALRVAAEAGLIPRPGPEAVRAGLAAAWLPGRSEVLRTSPALILDGAHNDASLVAALRTVEEAFSPRRLQVLFACAADKELSRMAAVLREAGVAVRATTYPHPRAAAAGRVAEALRAAGVEVVSTGPPEEELESALATSGEEDAVLVCGSFYLVSHLRARLLPRSGGRGGA